MIAFTSPLPTARRRHIRYIYNKQTQISTTDSPVTLYKAVTTEGRSVGPLHKSLTPPGAELKTPQTRHVHVIGALCKPEAFWLQDVPPAGGGRAMVV